MASRWMLLFVAAVPAFVLVVVLVGSLVAYPPNDFVGNVAWGLVIFGVLEFTLWLTLRRYRSTTTATKTK